ncbi:unnamed protein product [Dicrocoelium dendriticum]|nr:unnamed protein product [Dicrocoelium dendriticum]
MEITIWQSKCTLSFLILLLTISGWRGPQDDPRTELCTCPPQYSGKSCESCAVGFRRDPPNGAATDRCVACTCNNHATICHPETGQCECQHNTGGIFCDRCADGYYGNALDFTNLAGACKPCPCPTGAKCEEVFWPDRSVKVVCTDCPHNRAGIRCDRCAENFYGDPTRGISCNPCDCSDNVDPREFGNCDGTTGECLKCIFGTTGRHCEKCLPGHRRNFKPVNTTAGGEEKLLPARGCSPCHCDPVGTLASYESSEIGVCNPETGQCPCKPGVGGLRCERCYPGFYGFHSGQGCKPCDCDSIGAVGEDCDDQTGRCRCRPNVTGRQCNLCLPGFFNLTSIHGCEACECHPLGSEGSQCDATGQCKCKPFAVGLKCDRCQENHYNLEAGCLSCPACYNLIQARVSKLFGMLESVFGSLRPDYKPGSQASYDDKDLYTEMKKLNDTIVMLYRDVLQVGGRTSVVSPHRLTSVIQSFKKRVHAIKQEIDEIRSKPMLCSEKQIDADLAQLDATISEVLPNILEEDLRKMAEDLQKGIKLDQPDASLSKEADTLTELSRRLSSRAESLKRDVGDAGHLQANATTKISEAASEVKKSKLLFITTKQRAESITSKDNEIARRVEETNERLQKTGNQVYQVKIGISQLPNLTKGLRILGEVTTQWEDADNKSAALQKRSNSTAAELQNTMDRFRQLNGQLRESLKNRLIQAKQLEPQFKELQSMLNRILKSQELSSRALITAQATRERIRDFEEHIAQTKDGVPQALDKRKELEQRLEMVEALLRDLQGQAKNELDAATQLNNRANEVQSTMINIGHIITRGMNHSEGNKTRLREMRSRHDVEVVQEVSQATALVDELETQSKKIIELVDTTQGDVKQMSEDAASLLIRMKRLKEQLTESASGESTPVTNGEDAATRFHRLKSSMEQLRLPDRLNLLRKLNTSRTLEIGSIRMYLEEFKAHYEHLRVVNTLLPLRDVNCFYTGKEIEGDVLVYNPVSS